MKNNQNYFSDYLYSQKKWTKRVIKLGVLSFCLIGYSPAYAAYTDTNEFSISQVEPLQGKTTLSNLLNKIEKSTGYSVVLNAAEIDLNQVVDIKTTSGNPEIILKEAFANKPYAFRIKDKHIIIYKKEIGTEDNSSSLQQNQTYQGAIFDDMGESVIGDHLQK